MKKYLLLILAAASFLPAVALARTPCAWGDLYNFQTGALCYASSSASIPGCFPGYNFSVVTGQSCLTTVTLPVGCSSTLGFSYLTGQSCGSGTTSSAMAMPITITAVRYSPAFPKVNDFITTYVTIQNNSSADQNKPFQVDVNGTTVTVPFLAAGDQTRVTVPDAFSFSSPGLETLNTSIIYPIIGTSSGNVGDTFTNTLTFTSDEAFQSPILAQPFITSISPSYGLTGTLVTLRGYFGGVHDIVLSGPYCQSQYSGPCTLGDQYVTRNSDDEITFQLPSLFTPGTYGVSVRDAGSGTTKTNRINFTVTPSIISLYPTSGPVGTVVTVYGNGFTADNSIVHIGGTVSTDNISADGTSLQFTVPGLLPVGGYGVSVANTAHTYDTNTLGFTITSSPVSLESISFNPGTLKIIPGASFSLSGGTSARSGSLTVAIVGPGYYGGTDWNTVGNLLRGGSYNAVSRTVSLYGAGWTASFGGLPSEGYYTVLVYDGSYNLLGTGTLWVTYRG